MVAFHHVNLGVPVGGVDDEAGFLTEVLGYTRLELTDELRQLGANWFGAEDGSQIHVGADPEHRPAARAHVAVSYGSGLVEVERRLSERGIEFVSSSAPGFPQVLFCQDPAGNRWELRGDAGSTSSVPF
jgi:catechol 2,3-dioxygenase-like lactoylglutathione lyase family enzyme